MSKIKITIFTLVLLSLSLPASAQKSIEFEKGSWARTVAKAKEQEKLIFVDFYTQWCGPCLTMAQEVFVLPKVYSFYNDKFINAKIDAENGEGIELAKKYMVNSYPTYLFIDPVTQEAVHRSSSRQDPDVFIFTGESALIPGKRSYYLEANYEAKKNDLAFLNDYIKYKNSVYDRNAITKVLEHLQTMQIGLDNPMAWELFYNNINGYDNPFFRQVAQDYAKYTRLYGKEVVDAKLAKESSYAPLELLNTLPAFEGKKTNLVNSRLNQYLRAKDYDKAIAHIEQYLDDPTLDKEKFLQSLRFSVRLRENESYPAQWITKCGEYLRYIAYNYPNRQDPTIHYEYAQYLETRLQSTPPTRGKPTYTMRPDQLKPKPRK